MIRRVDHIGIVVHDIDATLPYYRDHLGLAVSHDERLPEAGVRLVYLDGGGTLIQLVQPLGPGPLADHLERHGEGLHHLCYAVDDIPSALAALAPTANVRVVMGGRGRRAAFLPPGPAGIHTELTEIEPVAVPRGGPDGG